MTDLLRDHELPGDDQPAITGESPLDAPHHHPASPLPPAGQNIRTRDGATGQAHQQAASEQPPSGQGKFTAQAASAKAPDGGHPKASEAGQTSGTAQAASARTPAPTHPVTPHPEVVPLMELGWRRSFLIRQRNASENAAKALIRRFLGWDLSLPDKEREKIRKAADDLWKLARKNALDVDDIPAGLADDLHVFATPINLLDDQVAKVEREMEKRAKRTPAAAFVEEVPGLSYKGLAILVAEAGDLGSYPDRDKLWKRLGLTPYAGHAYSTWRLRSKDIGRTLTADEWTAAGYNPRRRSLIFANVLNPQSFYVHHRAKNTVYWQAYEARQARTAETHPDWTPKHRQMDALRVAVKALVKDIRKAWRQASLGEPAMPANAGSPAATPPDA